MQVDEIELPITKPETEWVRGRAVQKVSPKRDHARVQGKLFTALDTWSRGRGEVGTEWRFRVAPPGEPRRPLVPDLAFVRNARLRVLSYEQMQVPAFAPDLAVEILSPSDDSRDVADKIDVYLRAGCLLVLVLDPQKRMVWMHDAVESVVLSDSDTLRHTALPEFELELGTFFADALDRPR